MSRILGIAGVLLAANALHVEAQQRVRVTAEVVPLVVAAPPQLEVESASRTLQVRRAGSGVISAGGSLLLEQLFLDAAPPRSHEARVYLRRGGGFVLESRHHAASPRDRTDGADEADGSLRLPSVDTAVPPGGLTLPDAENLVLTRVIAANA